MDTQNDWEKVTMALTMAMFGIYVTIGVGNSNIFCVHPDLGKMNPI